jgi:hypothetical protein
VLALCYGVLSMQMFTPAATVWHLSQVWPKLGAAPAQNASGEPWLLQSNAQTLFAA